MSQPRDLIGQVIGNHQIIEPLGTGGMAEVYKARHTELKIYRAIKFIRAEFAGSGDFQERFLREARAIAGLEHPGIVRIHDFGSHDGLYYMVMQYVDGVDLKRVIRERGPIPEQEAVRWVADIADALAYAHRRDIVHRDVKPENIMLDAQGGVHLMDFGIAKLVHAETALTQTGVGIGTPAYMAPEQAQGQEITAATDIYALGIVLYELLTGEQPFSADTPIAVLVKAMHDPMPLPQRINPKISDQAQAAILQATAKNPADRHRDAMAFKAELFALPEPDRLPVMGDDETLVVKPVRGTEQPSAPAPPAATPVARSRNGRARWFGVGALLAALLLAVWVMRAPDRVQTLATDCEKNVGEACYALALSYSVGRDVPMDEERALVLNEKACELRHPRACTNAGEQYRDGRGAEKDLGKALERFVSGCILADRYACNSAATMYRYGSGMRRDEQMAQEYYKIACELGFEAACDSAGKGGMD